MCGRFRWAPFSLLAALLLSLVVGCKKATPISEKPGAGLLPGETILGLHWLGKDNLAAQTNSGYFLGLWDKPQSASLESHVLDQLALAPLHLLVPKSLTGGTNQALAETNHSSFQVLRPLLDNLLKSEFYLEVSRVTNGGTDFGIAMRLSPEKAALWQTNFAKVFETFTNSPDSRTLHAACWQYEGWTLAGLGNANNRAIGELRLRVTLPRAPTPPGQSTPWLDGEANLQKLLDHVSFPIGLPVVRFALAGQPQGVETRAILDFPQPLPFKIEPWQIPTNLMHGPNFTFSAVQGVGPLISSLKFWKDLDVGPAPNQLFFWAHIAHPALTYVAAPMENASNALSVIRNRLLAFGNPWLTKNGTGEFEPAKNYDGVFCTAGNPLLGPFLKRDTNLAPNVLVAGWGASDSTNVPIADVFLRDLTTTSNLVYYDRELTGSRVGAWFYLAQGLRVMLWKAQVPFNSPSSLWLQSLGKALGTSSTRITQTSPSQLVLERASSVGLSSVELQLLSDYIESPRFPLGLHTTTSPGMKPLRRHRADHRGDVIKSSANATNGPKH